MWTVDLLHIIHSSRNMALFKIIIKMEAAAILNFTCSMRLKCGVE